MAVLRRGNTFTFVLGSIATATVLALLGFWMFGEVEVRQNYSPNPTPERESDPGIIWMHTVWHRGSKVTDSYYTSAEEIRWDYRPTALKWLDDKGLEHRYVANEHTASYLRQVKK